MSPMPIIRWSTCVLPTGRKPNLCILTSQRWSGDLIEERLALSEALPELYVYTRDIQGAIHEQHLMLPESPFYPFHRNLANHLHNAEPLAVPPEESRRNITVMEAAKRSAERGGEVIAIDC